MNLDKIKNFIKKQELDIKLTGNARFMDQKCTPDVLSTVAECIQNYHGEYFCVKDIWNSKFANETVIRFFQKPETDNKRTSNEYDKFFGQPIKLFEYAGIINLVSGTRGRANYYKINSKEILNWIAISDRKAFDFLFIYLKEVLLQSGILHIFESFLSEQNNNSFNRLKESYENFIIEYTPINKKVEVRRIFTKILNPLAVAANKAGTRRGRFSKDLIRYDELLYNRLNFRDLHKPKNVPRAEFLQEKNLTEDAVSFNVEKAKRQLKLYQGEVSEIHPYLYGVANHVHHIFPQAEFLELSDTLENLIVLTVEEHMEFAHRKSTTTVVSSGYQMVCLLAKVLSLQESLIKKKDDFYSLETYIKVLELGLDTSIDFSYNKNPNNVLKESSYFIVDYYLNEIGSNPYNIKTESFLDLVHYFTEAKEITLGKKLTHDVNDVFGHPVLQDTNIGVKQALNKIANLAVC